MKIVPGDELDRLNNRLERERTARCAAEELLESKSRELFALNNELRKLVDEREAQVLERTRELEIARDQALANSRAKSQFLANMSHEMRTPLNGVLGMLRAASQVSDVDRQQHLMNTALHSGQLLLALINDLLDVARFESGEVQLAPVATDLALALVGVMPSFALEAERRGLEFVCDIAPDFPALVESDDLRVKQLVCNLVGNAVKFTHQGFVAVSLAYREDSLVEILVRDTGIGIAAEYLDSIFTPFVQADLSITRNYGGSGLGLSICKKIVDAMGGSISLTSEVGRGSSFCVRFPAKLLAPTELRNCLSNRPDIRVALVVQGAQLSEHLCACLPLLGLVESQVVSDWDHLNWDVLQQVAAPWLILDGRLASRINSAELMECKRRCRDLKLIALEMSGANASFSFRVDGYLFQPLILHSLVGCISGRGIDEASRATERPLFNGQHLLVVDDNNTNYQVIASLLEESGLRLSWAENGERALAVFDSDPPDFVLMDVQMPIMDGLTATRRIRALQDARGRVPVVAMTAHAFEEDREKSVAAGMQDHLTKPVEPDQLFDVLRRYLSVVTSSSAEAITTGLSESVAVSAPVADSGQFATEVPEGHVYPGLDIAGALARSGGNWPLLRKLIRGVITSQEGSEDEMATLLAEGNLESLRQRAHKIKGTGATLGATRLAAAAAAIEQSIKERLEPSLAMFQEYYFALRELRASVELFSRSEAREEPAQSTSLEFTAIRQIGDLLDVIEKNLAVNLGLVKQSLAQLTQLVASTFLEPIVQQLNSAFDQFRRADMRILIEQCRARCVNLLSEEESRNDQ